MADIEILVDSSQVKTAKQDIQDLGNSFNSAAKSASVYMQAFAKAAAQSARDANYIRDVARANQEIINKNLKVSNSYNSAEASAAAFTEELRKQEAQAQKTARANQAAFNKQLGVSGPSAVSGGAGFGAIEGEILRLEAMYNKVALAAKVYEQAEKSLNRAVLMGVITSDQKEAKLAELSLAYQKVGNDAGKAQLFIDRFGENAQVSGRGLNRFGMYAQQVGYQVGDFLVQIQSGTNFLVAFGQQATQLAGLIPGVLGAALGIGISLATAIGAAFMRASTDVETSVDRQVAALKRLEDATKSVREQIDEMRFGESATAFAENEIRNLESQISGVNNLISAYRANIESAKNSADFEAALLAKDLAEEEIKALEENLSGLEEKLRVLKDTEEAQRMLNGGLSVAAGIQKGLVYDKTVELRLAKELVVATTNAHQVYARTRVESAAAQAALKEALSSKDAEQLNRAMEEALSAGLEFSRVDLNAIVALAAKNGWSLVGAIRAAAQAAQVGNVVTADPSMGPGFERGGKLRSTFRQVAYQPTLDEIIAGQSKKGGGADKKDPLEELRQQIKLENELLGVSEAQARVIQALGQDRSKYSEAEINAITAEIEAYNQKLEAVERTKQIMDTVKSSMEDAFMSMVDGTKSAKDAFRSMAAEIVKELYRVLVVQRLVGAISGAIGGGGGSFFSAPSTGSFGLPFGGAGATGGSMIPGKSYLVGENGPELVIPRHSGTVVNANQTANAMGGGGSVTVQNNITVTGSDAAMVRTEIAKMIPQITNATKAAVIDAKQRGGQMSAAFR